MRLCVVDEVDHMLQSESREVVIHLLNHLPSKRQLLMFSATLPQSVQVLGSLIHQVPALFKLLITTKELCERHCNAARVHVRIDSQSTAGEQPTEGHYDKKSSKFPPLPASVEHQAILCQKGTRDWMEALINLLAFYDPQRAIVFSNSRYEAGKPLYDCCKFWPYCPPR